MMERGVRVPPPRPFEGKRLNGRRLCPICGEDAGLKRGWWHKLCSDIWNLATNPRVQWIELKKQANFCWACGVRPGERVDSMLEVEHIRPLWALTKEERRELKWWLPFNLQLLCRKCHRAKTAAETRQRFGLPPLLTDEQRGLVPLGLLT